jgi:NAD(P)H-hydrate epimerase
MRQIEKAADKSGLSYAQMMENAGAAVADEIEKLAGSISGKRIVLLVGSGNNGGDALVAGHYLAETGAIVSGYLIKELPEDDPNLKRLTERGLLMAVANQDQRARVLSNQIQSADIIVDGILGTGFRLPLKGGAKDVLGRVRRELRRRENAPLVVAVDCPSGLDCDTGEVAEETLEANLTVTLAAAKPGLMRFPGAEYVGRIVIGDIGIPSDQEELATVTEEIASKEMVRAWMPARPKDAHKGTFGRVVVTAGSINYPGAAALAGVAAYRVGAGLVTMAVPGNIQPLIATLLPEATWLVLPHELGAIAESAADVLAGEMEGTDVLLLGPGFGTDATTGRFIKRLLESQRASSKGKIGFRSEDLKSGEPQNPLPPCIVDADGLKLLAEIDDWHKLLPEQSILTPHPGEMAVITGEDKSLIQKDRDKTAVKWAKKWGHIVVLKGANTVVGAPDGASTTLPFATAALARAGTGDVLAGAIAGLRAQGVSAYKAAILGGFLHGMAGEYAAEIVGSEVSVLAGEIAEALPNVIADLIGG